ncbi:hypothetical protein NP233_g6914 [Leucocoprinus birnbaumii]|uniref:Uncharacterized protein n=1 Tax=Leucocoprinus birnbaumii TaxID=56174 RepID=A0AAD5VSY4_9AGAR|nr:hypothetical protein NP233_g6914 [Leucocoprinus birnbaumii]
METPKTSPLGKSLGKVAARKANEQAIREYLCSLAGDPPAERFSCGRHTPIAYSMCISQTDDALRGAGFWFARCYPCKKDSWVPSLVTGKGLLASDEHFQTLLAIQNSLKPTPSKRTKSASGAPSSRSQRGIQDSPSRQPAHSFSIERHPSLTDFVSKSNEVPSRPVASSSHNTSFQALDVRLNKTFQASFLIKDPARTVSVNLLRSASGFFRLSDHKLVLGAHGIEIMDSVERHDRNTGSWLPAKWNEDLYLGNESIMFFRYSSSLLSVLVPHLLSSSIIMSKSPLLDAEKAIPAAQAHLLNLTLSAEHKLFLCKFNDDLRELRKNTPPKTQIRLHGFVTDKVIPKFLESQGIPGKVLEEKIYQFIKNRANRQAMPTEEGGMSEPATSLDVRAQSVRDLVRRDFRDAIVKGMVTASGNIGDFNRSLSDFIAGLSADDLRAYEVKAAQSRDDWKKALTLDSMLESQAALPGMAADSLRKLLGWENCRQFGNAVFFLSAAFRNASNEIVTKRYLVCNLPEFMTRSGELVNSYDTQVAREFAKFAGLCLPMHDLTSTGSLVQVGSDGKVQLGDFNINDMSLSQLQKVLRDFLVRLWVESDGDRGQEMVPWEALEDFETHDTLIRAEGFVKVITNLNPNSMPTEHVVSVLQALQDGSASIEFLEAQESGIEQQALAVTSQSSDIEEHLEPPETETMAPVESLSGKVGILAEAVSVEEDSVSATKKGRGRGAKKQKTPATGTLERRKSSRASKPPVPIAAKVKKGDKEPQKTRLSDRFTWKAKSPSKDNPQGKKRGRPSSTSSDVLPSPPTKVQNI